jgi:hypothetical protein
MNLDFVITNEFLERVVSNDQSIGIPTKSKFRFKVKWTQPTDLTIQSRRPHYLLPNVKEYGWENSNTDPTYFFNQINKRKQQSSYYFGLAWSGYTDGFVGSEQIERLDEKEEKLKKDLKQKEADLSQAKKDRPWFGGRKGRKTRRSRRT